jgi:hypothetical protein
MTTVDLLVTTAIAVTVGLTSVSLVERGVRSLAEGIVPVNMQIGGQGADPADFSAKWEKVEPEAVSQ